MVAQQRASEAHQGLLGARRDDVRLGPTERGQQQAAGDGHPVGEDKSRPEVNNFPSRGKGELAHEGLVARGVAHLEGGWGRLGAGPLDEEVAPWEGEELGL